MTTSLHTINTPKQTSPWWEILLVMAISVVISLIFPNLKIVGILIPAVYLLVERQIRKRTWVEIGFNFKTFPKELLRNLGWVLLVGIGTQALSIFGAYFFLPAFSAHVLARLPFTINTLSVAVIISLLVSTLFEEIIYRGLFQNRIGEFLSVPAAIGLTSLVFALMHYASGPALIVFVDLALIVVDSVIYGIIFARSHNVFVAWIAHFMADVVGIVFLLALAK
jgi:membrane protease YdiL (CAAX protease family)